MLRGLPAPEPLLEWSEAEGTVALSLSRVGVRRTPEPTDFSQSLTGPASGQIAQCDTHLGENRPIEIASPILFSILRGPKLLQLVTSEEERQSVGNCTRIHILKPVRHLWDRQFLGLR
jgi:hypothetical protein